MFFKLTENIKNVLKHHSGFTLIELIVALMLLSIIIAAFTPLLLVSYEIIVESGERSSGLYRAGGEIEKRLAEDMVMGEGAVQVDFPGGISFEMEGGMITESHDLKTFLTNVPTMSISPFQLNEGYITNLDISVTGRKTNFDSANSTVRITDNDGIYVSSTLYSQNLVNHVSETETDIRLTGQLNNSSGPYTVIIETSQTNEVVRAKLTVHLPGVMIVGEDGIFISDGSDAGVETWQKKYTHGNYTGVAWGSMSFVAAGINGQIGRLTDGSEWSGVTGVTGSNTINSIYRATPSPGRFIAVGENGTAYHSSDGQHWETEEFNIDISEVDFNDLVVGKKEKNEGSVVDVLVLVGEENDSGVIIFVEEEVEDLEFIGKVNALNGDVFSPLGGVVWGDTINSFAAVGNDGLILSSEDGEEWERRAEGLTVNSLNAVTWSGSLFVAVGENGVILNSSDGENWVEIEDNSLPDETLNAVTWSGSLFVAVGNDGVIITSADGINWFDQEGTGLSGDLYDIVFR